MNNIDVLGIMAAIGLPIVLTCFCVLGCMVKQNRPIPKNDSQDSLDSSENFKIDNNYYFLEEPKQPLNNSDTIV